MQNKYGRLSKRERMKLWAKRKSTRPPKRRKLAKAVTYVPMFEDVPGPGATFKVPTETAKEKT